MSLPGLTSSCKGYYLGGVDNANSDNIIEGKEREKAMPNDRNLELEEAAGRLGISPHTLRSWAVYKRRLPFLRMGRKILFKLSDLEAFERRSRVEAHPEVALK